MRSSKYGEDRVRAAFVALATTALLLAGCGGGGASGTTASSGSTPVQPTGTGSQSPNANPTPPSDSSPDPTSNTPSNTPTATLNTAPTISVSLVTQAKVGVKYQLAPKAQDADGDTLAFTISNRPTWATFNTATGTLSGTPGGSDAKTYSNVVISVSDGKATASLPPFSIIVLTDTQDGPTVALQWDVPTVQGAPIADLGGYLIHYGTNADELVQTIQISNPSVNSYIVEGLPAGTYYFAVRAFTNDGEQGELSNIIQKRVTT
ncbi:MAG TPA: putative Ig domain-containing protein [Steroidobacteraceae bacterium]|nr:putative Ig domain-containing protein [Steroidobacteraceae bacterium]